MGSPGESHPPPKPVGASNLEVLSDETLRRDVILSDVLTGGDGLALPPTLGC